MMPFQRYLQDDDRPARQKPQNVSNTLDIQIPSFLYQNPVPTLAHGGGAEVVTFSPGWYNNNSAFSPQSPLPPAIPVNPVVPPSSAGLPVYSASGFDLLSLLARVATRPNPQVPLGPVDMTCSFVVVDTRRYDHPIVYCSPSFCRLTGYEEHEILGRNCRFLQAPGGAVRKGETRRFTSQDPVRAMNKNLTQDKEVQTSIVNFRKDGSAFINLVTVIPIPGGVKGELHEKNEVVWHIGFQVDLTQQPGVILDKVRDGTYVVDQHTAGLWNSQLLMSKDATTAVIDTNKKKASTVIPQIRLSEDLNRKLRRSTSSSTSDDASSHPLSLILLSQAPDFIHVVSLKGLFLYISPAITRVLGYDPTDLLNKTMSDIAHPEDIVPLERQLKESSTLLLMGSDTSDPSGTSAANSTSVLISSSPSAQPRPVDLVFRARTKQGRYVWLECRGRLHVEPGKGRKAIILSGRAREMGTVKWSEVKEMARGPTITRALIQSALAASAASNIPIADNDPSDDSGAELVQAGTKRRRESSAATNFSVLAAIELSTLPAKTTTAVHPHSRPLPGTTPSSSLSPTLTPPTSSRHAEFWGMLSGLGHASGSFISLSRGVSDVLGYHPTSGSSASAGDSTHSNLVAAAVGSLQQQQQEVEHYVDATTNPCGNTAAEYNVSASGGTEGNEGIGSIYRYQQAMVAGPSGSSASPSSSTETSSGSSTRSSTLSSLSLRDALIGRRLRDLIVADSDLVSCSTPSLSSPGSSSGYANSPSPYTPSTSYNEAAHFGIRPRNKGKQNNVGGTRELVEATLRAWDEENRSEAKGQEANLSRPAPRPPVNTHSFDMQPPPARGSARGKGKVKSSSPSNNNQAVTIRCWMKTANRRGEWDLHAPIYGNVIPVVITLYRAVVSSMGDADQDPVARGLAALREADANSIKDDGLDVAPPPTLVQVRIDTGRSGFANAASPASSTTASESGTPAFSGGCCSSTEKELNSHRTNLPEANIFAELETGRGSSWQYELQQMRFQNRRMLEEIVSIEEALNKDKDGASSSDAEFTVDTSMDSTLESHDTSGDGARATSTDQVSGNGSINDSASPAVEPMSNTWPTSPMMETNDSISSLPTRPAYDPQSYSSFSPLVNFNTLMDNRYASNPPPLESPVISRSECPQYGYSQQPSQEQNFSQSPTAQSGSYGYDNDYSQIQYQHIYPNQGYTQHQSYVDEPMASPTDPYHSQAQQMQYTLHQPQPQLQQQGLDWGTAPTPHYHQQRRRSTYDGQ